MDEPTPQTIGTVAMSDLDVIDSSKDGIIAIAKAKAASSNALPLSEYKAEVGSTGLFVFSGLVRQEFLTELVGLKGIRVYDEMRKNDPVIGGLLFATEQAIRRVRWYAYGANDSYADAASFLESCMNDCSHSWNDFISEALTFLPFGYSFFEIVYKERRGLKVPKGQAISHYNDGRLGWRKFGYRPPDTVWRWEVDPQGGIQGMWQLDIRRQIAPIFIDMERSILFRTRRERNNPEGLALDPDTDIPTPDGWKKIDDLKEGDRVFDEQGKIRYVVATKEWENRPRYRIIFSSHEEIIADENHQWLTSTLKERTRKLPSAIRTTKEIFETQSVIMNKRLGKLVSNHGISTCKSLENPDRDLPIDPYVLGWWLGDGSSRSGTITSADPEIKDHFEKAGYVVTSKRNGNTKEGYKECWNWHLFSKNGKWMKGNLSDQLRSNNLIMNKHIPENYFKATADQRLSLLQGLMDSDGYVDKFGRCEFTSVTPELAYGVKELVFSLNGIAYVTTKEPAKDGYQTKYLVKFSPDFAAFKLKRKTDRVKRRPHKWHYIQKVEKLESGRTKCIQVDSPSGLFLASRSFIPTHNSVLRNAYKPYYFKRELEKFEAIALERTGAGIPVIQLPLGYTKTDLDVAKNVVRRIRVDEQMGVTLPPGWTLSLLRPEGRAETQTYEAAITRYSNHILMSLLLTFVALGTSSTGSFALVKAQQDFFKMALVGWVQNMSETINRYAVQPLFDLNSDVFSADIVQQPPEIKTTDIGEYDLDTLSQFIQRCAQMGFLTPDDAAEDWLRRISGLPELADIEEPIVGREVMRTSAQGTEVDMLPGVERQTTGLGLAAAAHGPGGNQTLNFENKLSQDGSSEQQTNQPAARQQSDPGQQESGTQFQKPTPATTSTTLTNPFAKPTNTKQQALKKAAENDKILRQKYRLLAMNNLRKDTTTTDIGFINELIEEALQGFRKAEIHPYTDDGDD